MTEHAYQIKVPDHPEEMVFINGMVGKTFFAKLWVMFVGNKVLKAIRKNTDLICAYGGASGFGQTILVSYWRNKAALYEFMNTDLHKKWVSYVLKNQQQFSSFNEIYPAPLRSGRYINGPMALAMVYPKITGVS
jgi:hypothetical protein